MSSKRDNDSPPAATLGEMIWGFTVSQALYAAAKLGIFDVLRDGPRGVELAAATGANRPALRRLFRALTTVDILIEDERGRRLFWRRTILGLP
jgi:hypothetical protein